MTTPELSELATAWHRAQQLYPLYSALAREFVIEMPSCPDLEAAVDSPPQESVEQAKQWLQTMDERIQVHQLRQFLQTTTLATDESLQLLLQHHLRKPVRSASDRDKIDFLLVQYFSHMAPSRLEDGDVELDYVAQVLEPVLGAVDVSLPAWLQPIDGLVRSAQACRALSQLLDSGILEKGRKLKTDCKENYFQPAAMVAFTRFSFLMRRVFFRLMHDDLNAILDGLRELQDRGVKNLDCRRAQFSADEPVLRLRMICQSWKVMFHAEYSSGQPLRMLVDLCSVVETALKRTAKAATAKAPAPPTPKTRAASAGVKAAPGEVPEFEVSGGPAWDPDNPTHGPGGGRTT